MLGTPADDTCSVCGPAAVPSVHDVSVAMPDAFVVNGVVGETEPLPDAGVKLTDAPAIGFELASTRRTDGATASGALTVPLCPSPATMTRLDGAPAVMLNVALVAEVSPALEKASAYPFPALSILRSLNVAEPPEA